MFRIQLKWLIYLSFFAAVVSYSLFSLRSHNASPSSFLTIETYSKNQPKNKYISNYETNYMSIVESLRITESALDTYKNPLLKSLSRIQIKNGQKPAFNSLWGDSALFTKDWQVLLKDTLQDVKNSPDEVAFYVHQVNKKQSLYFYYTTKESPSYIYNGEVNIRALEDRLTGNENNHDTLYIVSNDTILSQVNKNNTSIKHIVSLIITEKLNATKNNHSVKIDTGNDTIDYLPIFLPSNSLWLLIANNSKYDESISLFFDLPLFFLTFIIFLVVCLVFRPIFMISNIVGREDSTDVEKLYALTKEIKTRSKHIYFSETYRILSMFKKMADELLNYKKVSEYKLGEHKKAVALEYFERLRYEQQQRKNAIYDTLTGLPNSFLLEDRITTVIKHNTRASRPTCLILIDILSMREVAEEYSYIVSDSMLKSLSIKLNENIGHSGTLFRYDYCQFAVLLVGLKPDYDIQSFVGRLFHVINDPSAYVDGSLSETITLTVSCSIGVALADSPRFTYNKLIEAASNNTELCKTDKNNRLSNNFTIGEVLKNEELLEI